MVNIGRSIELQHSDTTSIIAYKRRLIDYLDRFIGDLVSRSGGIAQHSVFVLLPQAMSDIEEFAFGETDEWPAKECSQG